MKKNSVGRGRVPLFRCKFNLFFLKASFLTTWTKTANSTLEFGGSPDFTEEPENTFLNIRKNSTDQNHRHLPTKAFCQVQNSTKFPRIWPIFFVDYQVEQAEIKQLYQTNPLRAPDTVAKREWKIKKRAKTAEKVGIKEVNLEEVGWKEMERLSESSVMKMKEGLESERLGLIIRGIPKGTTGKNRPVF